MSELCSDLSKVQPGDLLLIGGSGRSWSLGRVARITQTQVIIANGDHETRYRKDGGRRIGDSDSWNYSYAYLYDAAGQARWQKLKQEHTRKVLANRINDTNFHDVDDATLQAIAQLLLAVGAGPDTLCEALSEFQRCNGEQAHE